MSDLHQVVFTWPYQATNVIVTGTFDQWERSVEMERGPRGFTATVSVNWGEKVLYKFIVDNRWTTMEGIPTETDWRGNVNNVYQAPPKPDDVATPRHEKSTMTALPTPDRLTQNVNKLPVKSVPAVPANDTKPVVIPSTTKGSTPVLPLISRIVPLGNSDQTPLPVEPTDNDMILSTHAPVNSPRKPPTPPKEKSQPKPEVKQPIILPPSVIPPPKGGEEKKELKPEEKQEPKPEEKREPKPEEKRESKPEEKEEHRSEEKSEPNSDIKQPNGISGGSVSPDPIPQPPATKNTTPASPATPTKSKTSSTSSSPTASPDNTISGKEVNLKKKRASFIKRVKDFFAHQKERAHKGKTQVLSGEKS